MFCMLLIKPFILTYFLENRIFWPNGPGLKYSDWTLVPQICFCSWKLVVTIQKASVPPFHNICSIIHCNEIYESVYKTLIMSRFYRAIFQTVKVLGSLTNTINYLCLELFSFLFYRRQVARYRRHPVFPFSGRRKLYIEQHEGLLPELNNCLLLFTL